MTRLRRALTLVVALGIVSAGTAGAVFGNSSAPPTLKGTVGPGFTITLKKSGTNVKVLKAGTSLFAISDKSSIHNFTLQQQTGGSLNKVLSATSFTGVKTTKVTLKKGKWKFLCTVHPTTMFGSFTVK